MTGLWNRTVTAILPVLACACSQGRVGDRVTIDAIVALEPGMDYAQVTGWMGPPLKMETELPERVERGVGIVGEMVATPDPSGAHVLLTYSEPGGLLAGYPMVWVHLRHGKVGEVYVKWYPPLFGDDEGIYLYSTDQARSQNSAKLSVAFSQRSHAAPQ